MFKPVNRIYFLRGLINDAGLFAPSGPTWFQTRNSSGPLKMKVENFKELPDELSYLNFLQQRQDQARRSVIIQIRELKSWEKIVQLFNNFGEVNQAFHYKVASSELLLLEMCKEDDLHKALSFLHEKDYVKKNSNLFLTLGNNCFEKGSAGPKAMVDKVSLNNPTGVNFENIFEKELKNNFSLSKILTEVYHQTKITELGMRLRFMTCRQLESIMSVLIPYSKVLPFGSSASGLGIHGCDLDVVTIDDLNLFETEKTVVRKQLITLGDILLNFTVGCTQVNCIKFARVPIVRYKQVFTGMDCDVTLYQRECLKISQILYIFSALHENIGPLVFTLKFWAKKLKLVLPQPGNTISNFSLIMLIIFFLQQKLRKNVSLIPPWDVFLRHRHNLFYSDEEVLSSLNSYQTILGVSENPLEELLLNFFTFYSSFDFRENGISLRTGKLVINNSEDALYIENPFNTNLNVSKNVAQSEVNKFKKYCILASAALQTGDSTNKQKIRQFFNIDMYNNKLQTSSKKSINTFNGTNLISILKNT